MLIYMSSGRGQLQAEVLEPAASEIKEEHLHTENSISLIARQTGSGYGASQAARETGGSFTVVRTRLSDGGRRHP